MRIPVTLLTGYLGAGKTTVINHLLGARKAPRFTVLVNDFGALDIDARLIADRGGDTITLSNGCACCSIGEDLSDALATQLALPSPPPRLVIEASGVAEPLRMARTIEAWSDLRLDAIATVADAGSIEARLADKFVGSLVRRQLKAADILLLNKSDVLDSGSRAAVEAWSGSLAPMALRLSVTQGAVDPALLFGPDRMASSRDADVGTESGLPHFHKRLIDAVRPIQPEALLSLLARAPAQLHRVKGFVCDNAGRVHLVQHVGNHIHCIEVYTIPGPPPPPGLVAIATAQTALDHFAAEFSALDAPPLPAGAFATGTSL